MKTESTPEVQAMILDKDQPNFARTPHVEDTINRSMRYIAAGLPIHFIGPAGVGKSSLSLYLAAQIGRPVVLVHGDEELSTSNLLGGEFGYRKKRVVDNFIHSVVKTQEDVGTKWVDKCLTVACKHGFTLVYDEFTRSRPEANNILLSVLEEKVLDLYGMRNEEHLRVHPDFRAIFTSNPNEYVGVHGLQDALRDRMVAIRLHHYDRETEIGITEVKADISRDDASRIVDVVRAHRKSKAVDSGPTVRAAIMIGKVLKQSQTEAVSSDEIFRQVCFDVLQIENDMDLQAEEADTEIAVAGLSQARQRHRRDRHA